MVVASSSHSNAVRSVAGGGLLPVLAVGAAVAGLGVAAREADSLAEGRLWISQGGTPHGSLLAQWLGKRGVVTWGLRQLATHPSRAGWVLTAYRTEAEAREWENRMFHAGERQFGKKLRIGYDNGPDAFRHTYGSAAIVYRLMRERGASADAAGAFLQGAGDAHERDSWLAAYSPIHARCSGEMDVHNNVLGQSIGAGQAVVMDRIDAAPRASTWADVARVAADGRTPVRDAAGARCCGCTSPMRPGSRRRSGTARSTCRCRTRGSAWSSFAHRARRPRRPRRAHDEAILAGRRTTASDRPSTVRGMEARGSGSRFVVRHVDVSVAAPETIWRWRGWASTDPLDRLRTHRSIDVYTDGRPESMPVVGYHQPLGDELQDALALVEWTAASTLAGAQDAWRPTLGALRSARRGSFKTRTLPTLRRSDQRRSRRKPQPVRLHRVHADVTNVWEGATIRIVASRTKVDLQVRSPGGFELGEVPPQIQKALRWGGESMRQNAELQLAAAARVIAGRIPSHDQVADLLLEAHRLHEPVVSLR